MAEDKNTDVALPIKQGSTDSARVRSEIEAAVILSRRFPREPYKAYQKILEACNRSSFASKATYSYPRGDTTVKGASVHLARYMAAQYGNIRYGIEVLTESDTHRSIRGFAWDLETNTYVFNDTKFKKLIYRKKGGWITPDERDMRELTNKHGAILVRNCILQLMPPDYIDDALGICFSIEENKVKKERKKLEQSMVASFAEINVNAKQLCDKYSVDKIAALTNAQVVELRALYRGIKDGHISVAEALTGEDGVYNNMALNLSDESITVKDESTDKKGE